MLSEGVPPKVVSERMGHATVAMTLDLYGHVLPQDDQAAPTRSDVPSSASGPSPTEEMVNRLQLRVVPGRSPGDLLFEDDLLSVVP
jgi:hypothetical protein